MEALEHASALVTGGAGFIGSHICEVLVRQGVRVVCLDNFVAGKEENVAHLLDEPGFSLVRADVSSLEDIEPHFEGIEAVFHNAASKNTVCRIDPRLDLDVNGWGAWCVEAGWGHSWAAATLALRQRKTSLWEFTSASQIHTNLEKVRTEMALNSGGPWSEPRQQHR